MGRAWALPAMPQGVVLISTSKRLGKLLMLQRFGFRLLGQGDGRLVVRLMIKTRRPGNEAKDGGPRAPPAPARQCARL